jgi:regulator of sigma E protease
VSYVLAFAGFALLIIHHEAGHFAAAKAVGMRVERFALFFPPLLFKVRRGETEYGIGAIPLGGYVRITGMSPLEDIPPEHADRAYFRQPVWKRVVVISAGPLVNVIIAFVLLTAVYAIKGEPRVLNKVDAAALRAPASSVLRPGDEILSVDGRAGGPVAFRAAINRHRCSGALTTGCSAAVPAKIRIRRAGRLRTVEVRPRYDAKLKRMLVGFTFASGYVDRPVGKSAGLAVSSMWGVTRETVRAIVRIFYSSQARKSVSGVVGSYEVTRESFTFDAAQAVGLLAIISLSLAVVNLFPFLPLDGGHIFWAIAEKLRGRPIPFRIIERASAIGFVLVMLLFVIGLSNDIGRLRGAGFGVR